MSVPSLIASDKVVLPSSLTVNWKSAKWNRASLMRKKMTLRQLSQNGFLTTDKISIWPFLLLSTRSNYSVIHTHKHVHTYLTIPKSVTDKWCKENWLHIATVYIFISKSADILLRGTKEEQKWVMNSRQVQKCSHLHKIHFTCSVIMNETCFTVKLVHTMWCTVLCVS